MTHLGVRTDEQWEEDRMRAIREAFEGGGMVVYSRDLPEEEPQDAGIPARTAIPDRRKVSKLGQWVGRLIRR